MAVRKHQDNTVIEREARDAFAGAIGIEYKNCLATIADFAALATVECISTVDGFPDSLAGYDHED